MSAEGTPAGGGNGGATPWMDVVVPKDAAGVFDAPMMDYIKNRGYDKLDINTALRTAITSHQQAEKLIGAPANDIIKMPKDAADVDAWARFNERVGVPKEAKEYDFSSLKPADGDLDQKLIDALRPALQKAHVSKTDAPVVLKALLDFQAANRGGDVAAAEAALLNEKEALGLKWGANAPTNLLIAKNTAKSLGIDQTAVDALEKSVGYSKVMEMFRQIGMKTGEDKLVLNQPMGTDGYGSEADAQKTLDAKMADTEWANRFSNGDEQAKKEFDNLTNLINNFRKAARQ